MLTSSRPIKELLDTNACKEVRFVHHKLFKTLVSDFIRSEIEGSIEDGILVLPSEVYVDASGYKSKSVTLDGIVKASRNLNLIVQSDCLIDVDRLGSKLYTYRELVTALRDALDDNFTVVSTHPERLPWKGRESCLRCDFFVENWSPKHRICTLCSRKQVRVTYMSKAGRNRKGGVHSRPGE